MLKILLSGCNGKMGQVITRLASQEDNLIIAAGYDLNGKAQNHYPVYSDINCCTDIIDVIIDFSHPAAFENVINFAVKNSNPLVLATTGLSDGQINLALKYSKIIPLFYSANMSMGVSLLSGLAKKAAKALENSYDIEIIEKHHNQKLDAPSGTAVSLANDINSVLSEKFDYVYDRHLKREKRSKKEIGIHSLRGGTIVGEHSIIFAGTDEIIELKHTALSRDIFAVGALKAAVYIFGKTPGLYNMDSMFS